VAVDVARIDPKENDTFLLCSDGLSGVVTEHAQMYNNLTGIQNLKFFGAVFGIGAEECRRRAVDILERLDLSGAKDQKLAAHSTGMRQRLPLARAMIHHPRILFHDEPTSGLDPESAQSVNSMIKSLALETGTTVFLCTHQLRYAEEICTGYGLISEGSMLAAGSLDELRALVFSGTTVTLRADRYPPALNLRPDGDCMCVDVNTQEEIPLLVKQIVDSGGRVYHVSARRLSLEEIYFALIERRQKDGL
jgi:ABC-2 type transport system ATP-binding protein